MTHDEIMEGFFGRSELPSVEAFGGIDAVLCGADELGRSMYSDHFVDLVLPFRETRAHEVDTFIVSVLQAVRRGPVLSAIMDRLFGVTFEDRSGEQKVFRHFLAAASSRENDVPLRAASLKGALGLLNDDNTRIARMIAEVADTDPDDDPDYISHAARIAGILYGRRNEPALTDFLRSVRGKEGCADQIELEFGLVGIRAAIEAGTAADVAAKLSNARDAFSAAVRLRESRYDARIYYVAIDLLLDFYEHRERSDVAAALTSMRSDAFAYAEYSRANSADPVLGAIATQTTALISLATSLQAIVDSLASDFWLEAATVIETQLLLAYSANQTILGGAGGRGVDCVIRPVLHPRVFGNRNHAAALKAWLTERAKHMPSDLTDEIRVVVEEYFDRGDGPDPSGAGYSGPLSPALIERVRSTDPEGHALLSEIAGFAVSEIIDKISIPIERALKRIALDLSDHEDYRVPEVRSAFNNLAFRVLSFLEQRLDSSVEQDKSAAYLFVSDKPFPREKELQQDFLRHAKALRLDIDDEVKGVAGGRADLRYQYKGHRMIIEVKREMLDASFDNIIKLYGDQTAIYQTTNVKLGLLLVLDLSKHHIKLDDFEDCFEVRRGDLLCDGRDRCVLVVKVPGRRGTPSVASKEAKSGSRRRKIKSPATDPVDGSD